MRARSGSTTCQPRPADPCRQERAILHLPEQAATRLDPPNQTDTHHHRHHRSPSCSPSDMSSQFRGSPRAVSFCRAAAARSTALAAAAASFSASLAALASIQLVPADSMKPRLYCPATFLYRAGQVQGGAAVQGGLCSSGGGAACAGRGRPHLPPHHAAAGRWVEAAGCFSATVLFIAIAPDSIWLLDMLVRVAFPAAIPGLYAARVPT